ncbi:MAG: hypothetical protein LCH73_04295 [Proteobacteria bacterium]|nr:hypothetical protein [Pseudomonadota bacterium]
MRALTTAFIVACGLLALPARADEAAAERLAHTDAAIALCREIQPQDAARFARLHEAPYTCTPQDAQTRQRLRALPVYRETYDRVMREVVAPLTRQQAQDFCQAQLDAHCAP